MALQGNQARVFLNGFDLSCVTSTLTVENTTGEYDATTLCSTTVDYRPGSSTGSIAVDGYFEGVETGEAENSLYTALGATGKIVAAMFDFTVLPAAAYVLENASNMAMTWTSPADGLLTMNGSFRAALGLKRGLLTHYQNSRTATGVGTAVQIPGVTTSSTGRYYVFYHSHTGTQSGNVTVGVQTSANGTSGWATEGSVSFAGHGASAAAFTAPAGAYWGLNVTSLGGTTGVTLSLIVLVDDLTS